MVVEPQVIELVTAPFREVAAAILVTEDERYLLQLRDDLPGIAVPGHWGCFGGGIDPGESAVAAMRRELYEELGIVDAACRFYTQSVHSHPAGDPTGAPMLFRYNFFEVPIRAADEPGYDQHEGAGRALFTIDEMMVLDRIAPWDLYAILCHARHQRLFRAGRWAFRDPA